MNFFTIENNVPIPRPEVKHGGGRNSPFLNMVEILQVDQSFLAPISQKAASSRIYTWKNAKQRKAGVFVTRKVDDNVTRIWRTA
jgi:hypothetical protein